MLQDRTPLTARPSSGSGTGRPPRTRNLSFS